MSDSREQEAEVTPEMLKAGWLELLTSFGVGVSVSEITPEDLRSVYIAMRSLDALWNTRRDPHSRQVREGLRSGTPMPAALPLEELPGGNREALWSETVFTLSPELLRGITSTESSLRAPVK